VAELVAKLELVEQSDYGSGIGRWIIGVDQCSYTVSSAAV